MPEKQIPEVHTISSSLPLTRSQPKEDRQRKMTVSALLARLAVHYYRQDFTEQQAKLLIEDIYEDLATFAVYDIEQAIKAYRANAKNKFFPTSGQLCELAGAAAKERAYLEKYPKQAISEFRDIGKDGKPCGRPSRWWQKPRGQWEPHWHEAEVPAPEREYYDKWQAAKT